MDLLKVSGARLGMAALLLALLAGCAHGGDGDRGAPEGDARDTSRAADSEDPPARAAEPRTIDRDAAAGSDPGAGTARRRASDGAVEEGKGYLITGRTAEAERRFERATRIDPTNGIAWYQLGQARARLGDPEGAIGVLEKAETLLGPYPDWRERAARLLAELRSRA